MLKPPDPAAASRLRGYLRDAGFHSEGFAAAGFGDELPARHLRNVPRLTALSAAPSPLHTLYRLFRIGLAEDEDRVASTLPQWFFEECANCGLLVASGGRVSAPAMLSPFEDLILASDHTHVIEEAQQADAVIMANSTTRLLLRYAVRRPSASTLEVCAGTGAIGLAAAAWSGRVTLTDLSRRAVEFAAFSAALNALPAECLPGDSFAPAAGRTFDLVLANPPFYVTPSNDVLFVHNELGLDRFCRRLVRQAPAYLNEGGFFQMLCEWVEVEGQDWRQRLSEWFDGSGCDVWAVKTSTTSAADYAQMRIDEAHPFDWTGDAARFPRWVDYYRHHGVTAIHGGMIAMRRRSGANWLRIDEAAVLPDAAFGDAVLRAFETFTFLDALPPERLLSTRLHIAPGVKLTQRLACGGGGFHIEALELCATRGFPRQMQIDPAVAAFLDELAAADTLSAACDRIARRSGAPPDAVRRECSAVARRLLEHGFLHPAGGGEIPGTPSPPPAY